MSIAAANTFTRNIYREWIKPDSTHAEEANVSKIVSLLVKGFALVFVLTLVITRTLWEVNVNPNKPPAESRPRHCSGRDDCRHQ